MAVIPPTASNMRIVLENPPPFYTNLDTVAGRVLLFTDRTEHIGAIVVKLEGEARTYAPENRDSHVKFDENHKVLYQVQQVFPQSNGAPAPPSLLRPGPHQFPFRLKIPFNNACSDARAMSRMSSGLLSGGVRVMDGSRQMLLQHVRKTLPPSFVAGPRSAEVQYYIKVTVQRPGFLNPNWRYQMDFRFMPIEEPRPEKTEAKAFAKRPFAFRPKAPAATNHKSFFGKGKQPTKEEVVPPSVEMCAWVPHPTILTCNKPVPLRLVATKKAASTQPIYLTSILIELIGITEMRCFEKMDSIVNRFVVLSNNRLRIPLTKTPDAAIDTEVQIPDLWRNVPLPNTVAPSFSTCNIARKYRLELRLGVSWETPAAKGMFASRDPYPNTQAIVLPLVFNEVKVYSGIPPPPEVLRALESRRRASAAAQPPARPAEERPPQLPPRMNSGSLIPAEQGGMYPPQQISPITGPNQVPVAVPDAPAPVAYDPLYPPPVGTPGAPAYDDAPPSYDEAMAEVATGPTERPPFSGETGDAAPAVSGEGGELPVKTG
ncbi:hypothetical protein VUR80DRAFT_547 [Thermomyces stellatus]